MLYNKICFVGLSIYATLNRTVFGSTYIAYASGATDACYSANASDICEFHCDKNEGKMSYNCQNAGICEIYCESKKCLSTGTLNASNSLQLNAYANGESCYSQTTFILPAFGNVTISASDVKTPFDNMIIESGSNTNEIYLNCTIPQICTEFEINAQTAKSLYIDAERGSINHEAKNPSIVNCPPKCSINAANSGSLSYLQINVNDALCDINIAKYGILDASSLIIRNGSCSINATIGGVLKDVSIDTLWGYPHDIVIDIEDTKDIGATLTCSEVDGSQVKNDDIVDPTKSCWFTRDPTSDLTKAPSSNSTQSTLRPTQYPSLAPTQTPSLKPTLTPSLKPTLTPSLTPTQVPLTPTESTIIHSPSFAPHNNTKVPSKSTSLIPTLTLSSANITTHTPTETVPDTSFILTETRNTMMNTTYMMISSRVSVWEDIVALMLLDIKLVIAIFIMIVGCCMFCCGCCMYEKSRAKSKQLVILREPSRSRRSQNRLEISRSQNRLEISRSQNCSRISPLHSPQISPLHSPQISNKKNKKTSIASESSINGEKFPPFSVPMTGKENISILNDALSIAHQVTNINEGDTSDDDSYDDDDPPGLEIAASHNTRGGDESIEKDLPIIDT